MSIKLMDEGGQEFLNILFGATVKPTVFTIQLLTDSTPWLMRTFTPHTPLPLAALRGQDHGQRRNRCAVC